MQTRLQEENDERVKEMHLTIRGVNYVCWSKVGVFAGHASFGTKPKKTDGPRSTYGFTDRPISQLSFDSVWV